VHSVYSTASYQTVTSTETKGWLPFDLLPPDSASVSVRCYYKLSEEHHTHPSLSTVGHAVWSTVKICSVCTVYMHNYTVVIDKPADMY